jgi:alpha-beta hydrolase superfamily lysophospholipase
MGRLSSHGAVIAPPIGYEYAAAHRTLRVLAEQLAGRGWSVLRVDYDGTGDSAGDQLDPERVRHWRSSIGAACDEVRLLGAESVCLIGAQVGGAFALLEADGVKADQVVLWDPMLDGRRFVRAMHLLGEETPRDSGDAPVVIRAGTAFDEQTQDDLRMIRLTRMQTAPVGRILVVDRGDEPECIDLVNRMLELGASVDHLMVPGTAEALDQPAEYAVVAGAAIDAIIDWLGEVRPSSIDVGAPDSLASPPPSQARTVMTVGSTRLVEEIVTLAPEGLVGILTSPIGPSPATVVWLNAGSEPHIGPGRVWVEFSRSLALRGYASLRLDFSGWGESPDLGHDPGRPYDHHGIAEVVSAVRALRGCGHRRVLVAGLCAGAWLALRAPQVTSVDGVIAINPQLYWQEGDPSEANIERETRHRRESEIDYFFWGRSTGLWAALERLGADHPVDAWLDNLRVSGCPTLTVFAEGDDGLEFLNDRVATSWNRFRDTRSNETVVVPGLDHSMHRRWLRVKVVEEIAAFLDRRIGEPIDLDHIQEDVPVRRSDAAENPTRA